MCCVPPSCAGSSRETVGLGEVSAGGPVCTRSCVFWPVTERSTLWRPGSQMGGTRTSTLVAEVYSHHVMRYTSWRTEMTSSSEGCMCVRMQAVMVRAFVRSRNTSYGTSRPDLNPLLSPRFALCRCPNCDVKNGARKIGRNRPRVEQRSGQAREQQRTCACPVSLLHVTSLSRADRWPRSPKQRNVTLRIQVPFLVFS